MLVMEWRLVVEWWIIHTLIKTGKVGFFVHQTSSTYLEMNFRQESVQNFFIFHYQNNQASHFMTTNSFTLQMISTVVVGEQTIRSPVLPL